MKEFKEESFRIAIIGLGYVGLPLATALSEKFSVVGFDVNDVRVTQLNDNNDITGEVESNILKNLSNLNITNSEKKLQFNNIYIVTVPTPIDNNNEPDLTFLESASELVGRFIEKGDIVVFESTVYPGCTEEFCIPIIEKKSTLKYNIDFFAGYSPERINPGDKVHTIKKIKKVISASNKETLDKLEFIYGSVIEAGIFKASSIKVAEAAKVIENSQRDLNIAFVNELSHIFRKIGIDTP
jgi:nucleotide sugar dehydrogenase